MVVPEFRQLDAHLCCLAVMLLAWVARSALRHPKTEQFSLILSLPSTFQLSAGYQGFHLDCLSFSEDCWVIACISSSRMRSVGDRILKKRPALNPLSLDANLVGLCAKGKRDRHVQQGNERSSSFRTCLMRDGRTGRQAARMPNVISGSTHFPMRAP